jgi:hypothetical protein
MYDYLFFNVAPGPPPYRRAGPVVPSLLTSALAGTAAEVKGVFVSQLGWANSQAAALIAWPDGEDGRDVALRALAEDPSVASLTIDRLTPTARPQAGDAPRPGGIHVHRWFHIRAEALDEFVALSTQGWRDFEVRFDANIYGLFAADRSSDDVALGVLRLLLITRYGDHGVWETSRDPTSEAMQSFARRQALTRFSVAASSLLVRP